MLVKGDLDMTNEFACILLYIFRISYRTNFNISLYILSFFTYHIKNAVDFYVQAKQIVFHVVSVFCIGYIGYNKNNLYTTTVTYTLLP